MKKILSGLLGFIFILGLAGVGSAEEAAAPVLPKVSIGGDIRLRGEITKNNSDFDGVKYDNTQYFRNRTRLWVKGEVEDGYTAYVRLAIEPRWGRPDTVYNDASRDTTDPAKIKSVPESNNHLILDNAYIEAKDFAGTPLTLKVGRQDMMYGEGFLIADGTDFGGGILNTGDGSRTAYFDAIKLSSVFSDTSVDLFTAKINENQYKAQDDEDLYGLYITNKSLKDRTIEVYGLHRAQRTQYAEDPLNPTLPPTAGTVLPKKNQTTAIGVRSTGKVIENLSYGVELVKEFGKYEAGIASPPAATAGKTEVDRDAMGGLAHLTYAMPEVPAQPSIKVAAYYTSGDDADTDENESWDGFYSEFPKYGYADVLPGMAKIDADNEGIWSNHMIYEVDIKAKPIPKLTTSLGYLYMMANEQDVKQADGKIYNAEGKVRGRCPQARIDYQFTKAVSGFLAGQYFYPGDYYKPGDAKVNKDDTAFFGRAEVMIKF